MSSHAECAPTFLAQTFRKKSFILIQYLIYLHLDTCFLYYRLMLAFIFEHIVIQKFYVTNNYKTQEQIQEILCTGNKLVLLMYNTHCYFSLKNLGKKVCTIHGKIW